MSAGEKQFNPIRPDWDASEPGHVPEPLAKAFDASGEVASKQEALVEDLQSLSPEAMLDRLDAMTTEATTLANSAAQAYMTPEQNFIYGWQRQAQAAAGSLHSFRNPANNVEDREMKIEQCQRTLVQALYRLGQFESAIAVAGGIAPELVEHIKMIQAAIDAPDADLQTHECARPTATIEHQGKDVQIELDRRWDTEQVISPKHGKLVHVWRCSVCGEMNATPDAPERQQGMTEAVRAQVQATVLKGENLARFEAANVLAKGNP